MKKYKLLFLPFILLNVLIIGCEKDNQKPNQKPTCDITSPSNGFGIKYGNEFTISANCNDPDGSINMVEFYLNGVIVKTFDNAPYTTNIKSSSFSSGELPIKVIAYDDDNETAEDNIKVRIEAEYANIKTLSVTEVTDSSALVNCEILDFGDLEITSLGICCDSTSNPTVDDNKLETDINLGKFSIRINNLLPGVTYYVRAFATNSKGISYGDSKSFDSNALKPTIVTTDVSDITETTCNCGGNVSESGGLEVTSKGLCWNTSGNPSLSDKKSNNGSGIGEFTTSIDNLVPNTDYFIRAYATNSLGTSFGEIQEFTTNKSTALVSETNIQNITSNSARVTAEIVNDFGSTVTERGICWAQSNNPSVNDNRIISGEGTGVFSTNMTELNPGTIYYLKAYAINEVGIAYGELSQFKTQAILPKITTSEITGIQSTTAKSGGEIIEDGGSNITSRGVCWNTTGNPMITDLKTSDGNGSGSFQSQMSSLKPATTYYIKAYAINEVGTAYGEQHDFTTTADIPEVSTESFSDITSTSVIINSEVISMNGSAVTERGVVWNIEGNPSVNDNKKVNGNGKGAYSTQIIGLIPGTKHYIKAFATNAIGTSYGANLEITTEPLLPTVTTKNITGITYNGATGGGNVTSDGGGTVTSRGICWNKTGSPTINDYKATSGSGTGDFTRTLSSLQSETNYYIRAWAQNSKGIAYGNQVSFTTSEYLNQPRWLYYDDGAFGLLDYITSTYANSYFIVRFKVPSGWGDVTLSAIKIDFANSSTSARFDILFNDTYSLNSSNVKFPAGTTYTLQSNAIPEYNTSKEYNVLRTVNTKEFFVSLKSKNSYRLCVYADAKPSDVGDYTSLLIDNNGSTAWLKQGHIAIRAYIKDKSDLKSAWIEAEIISTENEFIESNVKGKAIENLFDLNLEGIKSGK